MPPGAAPRKVSAPTIAPAPAPASSPVSQPHAEQHTQAAVQEAAEEGQDLTQLPTIMDKGFDALGDDVGVRPTIVKAGEDWQLRFKKSLISNKMDDRRPKLEDERNKAFDLLDALSRSGGLSLDSAALHVVVAATHCFDKSLIATLIQDNINPIDKVEKTSLVMAAGIHGVEPSALVGEVVRDRIRAALAP